MRIFTNRDADPALLEGRKLAVIGYGNQGRPQSLNLRDSGLEVLVGARENGRGWMKAVGDGFRTMTIGGAVSEADVVLLLLPDEVQKDVFDREIKGNLREKAAVCFAHGFSVAFGGLESPDHDMILVAPKGQGGRLRKAYLEGTGIPCLFAVANDASGQAEKIALALAHGLGCLRVGAYRTSFREETVSDLFGEQAVLCGGVPALMKRAFDVLVGHGFSPEVAYFECLHELEIIVDLVTRRGFSGMRDVISGTAAYGSLLYGENLIGEEVGEAMERVFDRIESGRFARDWLSLTDRGKEEFIELREKERKLPVEEVGDRIRRMIFDKERSDE